jgi:DNA-binding FadR family transcriptional regulator
MDPSDLNLNMSRQTLPEQLASQIEELIQNSSLSPGSRLPGERELAQKYSLSRSVIREAIGILHARGLVEARPGKGTFVTHLDLNDSVDAISRCLKFSTPPVSGDNLAELRLAIEPAAAAAAALNAQSDDIKELRSILSILKDPDTPDEEFIQNDLAFHLAAGKISGNPLFSIMIESITAILHDFMTEVYKANISKVRASVIESHGTVLKHIEAHEPEKAAAAMRRHIEAASA